MNRTHLAAILAQKQPHLTRQDVEFVVKTMLDHITQALASGARVELRGLGSFSLNYRPPHMGRNPKTGEPVAVPGRYAPHFKPGKELLERVAAATGEFDE